MDELLLKQLHGASRGGQRSWARAKRDTELMQIDEVFHINRKTRGKAHGQDVFAKQNETAHREGVAKNPTLPSSLIHLNARANR